MAVAVAVFALGAITIRFVALGDRPLHHDESIPDIVIDLFGRLAVADRLTQCVFSWNLADLAL